MLTRRALLKLIASLPGAALLPLAPAKLHRTGPRPIAWSDSEGAWIDSIYVSTAIGATVVFVRASAPTKSLFSVTVAPSATWLWTAGPAAEQAMWMAPGDRLIALGPPHTSVHVTGRRHGRRVLWQHICEAGAPGAAV